MQPSIRVNNLLNMCVSVRLLQREQGHYYGYVYFRQVRDKSLKRGYFQKVSEQSHFLFNEPKMCQHVNMADSDINSRYMSTDETKILLSIIYEKIF